MEVERQQPVPLAQFVSNAIEAFIGLLGNLCDRSVDLLFADVDIPVLGDLLEDEIELQIADDLVARLAL